MSLFNNIGTLLLPNKLTIELGQHKLDCVARNLRLALYCSTYFYELLSNTIKKTIPNTLTHSFKFHGCSFHYYRKSNTY